jgi:periplasmic copper chaperone A
MAHSRLQLLAALMFAASLCPHANAGVPLRVASSGFIRVDAGEIMVEQAWARASAGAATTGAAYVTLMGGTQPDRLTGVSTDAAKTAEVHESFTDNGVMKMRPVAGLPIPAGKTVSLTPGGYHVMLFDLKKPLVAGERFPLTLQFEHAAPITVNVEVRALGKGAPAADHQHMQMK